MKCRSAAADWNEPSGSDPTDSLTHRRPRYGISFNLLETRLKQPCHVALLDYEP